MADINVVAPGTKGAYTPYGGSLDFLQSKDYQVFLYGGTGTGKCLANSKPILTTEGWKTHGTVTTEDITFSGDGTKTIIVGVYPQGVVDIYKVAFNDGTSAECSLDHLWQTQTLYERRKFSGNPHQACGQPKVRTLQQIIDTIENKHFIPVVAPVQFDKRKLIIPPYTLGALLGDGSLGKGITLSSKDEEIFDRVKSEIGDSHNISTSYPKGRCPFLYISKSFKLKLEPLGLSNTTSNSKFIPTDYLFSDIDDRVALLKGILDTDGYIDPRGKGSIEYVTVSKQLALDVLHLVQSLGGIAVIKEKQPTYTYKGEKKLGRLAYRMRISLPNGIEPFYLSRKAKIVESRTKYKNLSRKIVSIDFVRKEEATCISVDHESSLYLTNDFIVTHNTLSCCYKMMLLCMKYPGCKFLFTRSSYTALIKSGVETFERVLKDNGWEIGKKDHQIRKLGESKPTEYIFPYAKREGIGKNGEPRTYEGQSRIVLASLDNARDQLGAEYDFVYVNQPEQSDEDDWQYLCSRADGRYDHAPWNQIFGDPNPEHAQHWIKRGGWEEAHGETEEDGRWRLIKSHWTDNPVMFDMVTKKATEEGEKRIARAYQTYNKVMAERLIEGEWASYEGLVYAENWDRKRHTISSYLLTKLYPNWEAWDSYWAIDFGYDDPFVWMEFRKHPEKDLYINTKLIYKTNKTIIEHAEDIKAATLGTGRPKLVVADRNPQEIALLQQALGVNIISAKKGPGSIKARINVITDMLKNNEVLFLDDALVDEDQRLVALKKPIGFQQEVDLIRWRDNARLVNDMPMDGDDHAENAMGYLFIHIKANERKVPLIWI